MIPSAANSDYPIFVADQVLTSDNLNDLFGYLDEQGRMTRTNLIGMGIVCGLQVITAADGSSITITKGVGVTSAGYLVTVPEITYTQRTTDVFDAVKCAYYDKFVNISSKTQRFDMWELVQDAQAEGTTPLITSFLTDKVVMIFVELLEENNKNCDPDSCDDKGTKVTVTFRPLLVKKSDTATLISAASWVNAASFNSLPDIFIPRWDVPNTSPVNADNIIAGYKNILTQSFITAVQSALTLAYQKFQQVISKEYPADPFAAANLINSFAFLYNGIITTNQSIHIQYYYDFFSDLIAAYNEFCLTGNEIISSCCPDEALFPRHLLLGEAIPLEYDAPSSYRHYFIYSPLFQKKDLLIALKILFRRMDLMVKHFVIPPVASSGPVSDDAKIKINPSSLSRFLSAKAIPYYYSPNVSPKPLYKNWSPEKQLQGRSHHILSYNSNLYNTADDFVVQPLKYDLEPYNFFRVEGITGKNVATVLNTITNRIKNFRLPVDVVALATGDPKTGPSNDDECCNFTDIELQFGLLVKELLCCLKNNIAYWGSIEKTNDVKGNIIYKPAELYEVKEGNLILGISKTEMTDSAHHVITTGNPVHSETADTKHTARNTGTAKNTIFITEHLADEKAETMAKKYLEYQLIDRIIMSTLPAPKTNTAEQIVPYYILIIIDELEQLVALLAEPDIKKFNLESFKIHADKLQDASSKLSTILSAYHSTGYLIEKIRINTGTHTADVDKIAAAMPVMTDVDANKIILLLLNLTTTSDFITALQKNTGKYSAQQTTISTFYKTLDKDGMMIPIMKEPDAAYTSGYKPLLEYLKMGMCSCIIDKLKYLIEEFKKQLDKLSDLNNFSVYAQNNPGLQHKAGVTPGGTFVIVYKGSKDPGKNIAPGTVIGDFYLSYTCCSNCTPIQVVINEPPAPAELKAEPTDPVCDAEGKNFTVTINISGGTPPYKVDGAAVSGSTFPVTIVSGKDKTVIIEDNTGQKIEFKIPAHTCTPPIAVTAGDPVCDAAGKNFTVTLTISGGTTPYKVDGTSIPGNTQPVTVPSGQQKTVTIEDTLGQKSDFKILAHNCPPPISADPGDPVCDAAGKNFTVTVTISGGTPPYKVNGTAIPGNTQPVTIPSGQDKTVTIEDSTGQKTDVKIPTHACPLPIAVDPGTPDCDATGKNFTVVLTISGGTEPYKVNGTSIPGHTAPVTIPSGQDKTVSIEDSAGQKTEFKIPAHTCPVPCDLPCDGNSEKCNYILWFQKPVGDKAITHRTEKAVITLIDENGNKKDIDVTEIFRKILDKNKINGLNYDAVFEALFRELNQQIPPEFLGNGDPMFDYDPNLPAFTIERFTCQEVLIEIHSELVNLKMKLDIKYDDAKVVIRELIGQTGTAVPKFGCIKSNKCTGEKSEVCKKPFQIKQINAKKGTDGLVVFSALPSFDFYYWYFEDGRPMYSDEGNPKIRLSDIPEHIVRLLAVNNDGCFNILEKKIAF